MTRSYIPKIFCCENHVSPESSSSLADGGFGRAAWMLHEGGGSCVCVAVALRDAAGEGVLHGLCVEKVAILPKKRCKICPIGLKS